MHLQVLLLLVLTAYVHSVLPEPPVPLVTVSSSTSKYGWSDQNYKDVDSKPRPDDSGRFYGKGKYNDQDDGYYTNDDDDDESGKQKGGSSKNNDQYNGDNSYGKKKDGYSKNNDQYNEDNGYGKKKGGSSKNNDQYNEDDGYGKKKDGYGKNNDQYNDDDDNYDDEEKYDTDSYRAPRQKRVPDEYGNMNIYIREPSKYGKSKKYKKTRFPVHRFKPGRFPPLPPLISFLPWLPIFTDRLTKQTIIFSPTGGLYIIPPVINFYGKLFSVAELISTGYASLVSTGIPPPAGVNVAPLVAPGALVGPGVPPPNVATGGFVGGVQTGLGAVGGAAPAKTPASSKGSYGY